MPARDPLTDPRFADLITELRDARIASPETLTDRVDVFLAHAGSEPVVLDTTWHTRLRRARPNPPRLRRPPLRWFGVAAMAAAGIAIAYGVVTGPGTGSSPSLSMAATSASGSVPASSTSAGQSTTPAAGGVAGPVAARTQPPGASGPPATPPPSYSRDQRSAPVPPTPGRYQQYAARIHIAVPSVERLSDVTTRVITTTQALGGYVLSVAYGQATPNHGSSFVDVKVPVRRVQAAIARFSALGTIASEHVSIQDEQGTVDSLATRISELELRIAQLNAALASPSLSLVDAVTLRVRRAQSQHDLDQSRLQRSAMIGQASYAELQLTFAVVAPANAPKALGGSSLIERDARGGLHVLGVVSGVILYVGIVALPFALVVVLALLVTRSLRRRRDRHVLERA